MNTMLRFILILIASAAGALAQSPTVTSTTTVTATAGPLICVGTPGANASGVSTMHMDCKAGAITLHTSDSTVPAAPGTGIVISVTSDKSSITWLLTKGNAVPDGWQVSATDGTTIKSKSGTF